MESISKCFQKRRQIIDYFSSLTFYLVSYLNLREEAFILYISEIYVRDFSLFVIKNMKINVPINS